jgi:hypothetical protein
MQARSKSKTMSENSGQDLRPPTVIESMTPQEAGAELARMTAAYRPPAPPLTAQPSTPEQAAHLASQITSDPKWVSEYLNGSKRHAAQLNEALALAETGDMQPETLIEVVNAVDNPSALRRSHYEGLMEGLRDQGLPEKAEQYIRDFDAGRETFQPSEGDGVAFKKAFDRLMKDPAVQRKYLEGVIDEDTNKANNLLRVVALAAPDGQPVSAEGIEILTRLGLR